MNRWLDGWMAGWTGLSLSYANFPSLENPNKFSRVLLHPNLPTLASGGAPNASPLQSHL